MYIDEKVDEATWIGVDMQLVNNVENIIDAKVNGGAGISPYDVANNVAASTLLVMRFHLDLSYCMILRR